MTLNQTEYNEKKSILESYPSYVFLELTKNCNLHCSMCRQHVMYSNDWFMSDDLLKKVEEEVLQYAKVVDLRGWGESSLDPRLIPLAKRLREKNIKTMLYTNMCAQTTGYWKDLVKTGIRLAVSIEAGDPIQYSKIRRGGSLAVVINHIKGIMEEVEKDETLHKPYFTMVLSEKTLDFLDKLIILASNLGVERIELNPISKVKMVKLERLESVLGFGNKVNISMIRKFEYISDVAKKHNVKVNIAANMFNENSVDPHICIHPWRYCVICSDGNISFCDHLLSNENAIMGNLKNESFLDIWNSEKYVELRKTHASESYECFEGKNLMCGWCSVNRYGNNEYLIADGVKAIGIDEYIENLYRFVDIY